MKALILILLIALLPLTSRGESSLTETDAINVIKISPKDKIALISAPGIKTRTIKQGDRLNESVPRVPGSELRVIEIAEGRVVLEEKKGNKTETIIVRLEDGKQRIERIKKAPEQQPQSLAPYIQQEQKLDPKNLRK